MSEDMYWGGMWADGSTVSWLSLTLAQRQLGSGSATLPGWLRWHDEQPPLDWLLDPVRFTKTLTALAVVDAWRTVTTTQVAKFTGFDIAKPYSQFWAAMWHSGLLDVGFASAGLLWTRGLRAPYVLLRPAQTKVFEQQVAPLLTYAEHLAVTGGTPWMVSRQADRHNVLCNQLALHAAHIPAVGVVHGEKWGNAGVLGFDSVGMPRPTDTGQLALDSTQASADLVVVRKDGLKIAVELTASTSSTFAPKVKRWAHVMSLSPLERSGLVVLFVNASPPERYTQINKKVRQAISDAVQEAPAADKKMLASRIGYAGWQEWFPALDTHTDAGVLFSSQTPPSVSGGSWGTANFLDLNYLPLSPNPALLSPMSNSGLSAWVPHQLRTTGIDPQLWRELLELNGFNHLPTPTPTRPERGRKGRKSGWASGGVQAALMPKRLTHPLPAHVRNNWREIYGKK